MHATPVVDDEAPDVVKVGAAVRSDAELQACCTCGAKPFYHEVTRWDPENPQIRRLARPLPGGLTFATFIHARDCPAASDETIAALEPVSEGGRR